MSHSRARDSGNSSVCFSYQQVSSAPRPPHLVLPGRRAVPRVGVGVDGAGKVRVVSRETNCRGERNLAREEEERAADGRCKRPPGGWPMAGLGAYGYWPGVPTPVSCGCLRM